VPYCHLWPAPLYDVFPHYLIKGMVFGKNDTEHRMCFDFLYKFCLIYFLFQEKIKEILLKMFIGLHVKYPSIVSDFNDI